MTKKEIVMSEMPERRQGLLNPRLITLVAITLAAAAFRVVAPFVPQVLPPNFAPVAAMALFGGAYFRNRVAAFVVPVAAMLLSDFALGVLKYDKLVAETLETMPIIYACFGLCVFLGWWIRRQKRSPLAIGGAALTSSIIFYLLTNFWAW